MFKRLLPIFVIGASTIAPLHAQETERRFPVSAFDAIHTRGSDRVRVVTGGSTFAVATGAPRALEALRIEVKDRVLYIERKPGDRQDKGVTVTVAASTLRAVTMSGSGSVELAQVTGPAFLGDTRGSGALTLNDVDADLVEIRQVGSGAATVTGRARSATLSARGSGAIDSRALKAQDLTIDMTGSASIRANASGIARINTRGSGSINVNGGPQCVVDQKGTGTLRCG
jgi:hypothetical protein